MLFIKAVEQFAEYLRMIQRSEKTVRNYSEHLIKFNEYMCRLHNQPVYLEDVKAEDMQKYLYNELSEEKYSSSHRHNMITAFRSIFNFCTSKGYCEVNTGKQVKFIKVYTKERITVSELEFAKICKRIKSATVKAVLQTIFYTGLRISEAISLKLEDVNFEHEYVHVKKGKGRKERIIPMNDKVKKILSDYISNDRVYMSTDNFFSSRTGRISVVRVEEVLRYTIKEMGIDKQITPHVLRHSFASNLIDRGVDLFRIQKLLGHESLKTTSIYLHTDMDELERTVNML